MLRALASLTDLMGGLDVLRQHPAHDRGGGAVGDDVLGIQLFAMYQHTHSALFLEQNLLHFAVEPHITAVFADHIHQRQGEIVGLLVRLAGFVVNVLYTICAVVRKSR